MCGMGQGGATHRLWRIRLRQVFEIIQVFEPTACSLILFEVFKPDQVDRYAINFGAQPFSIAFAKFHAGNCG